MATKPTRCYYCLSTERFDMNMFKLLLNATRKQTLKTLFFDDSFNERKESRCCFGDNSGYKRQNNKKRPEADNTPFGLISMNECLKILAKQRSVPNVLAAYNITQNRRYSEMQFNKSTSFRTNHVIRTILLDPTVVPLEYLDTLRHPLTQAQLRIYQCQRSINQENYCCSCESDTVLKVMKYLDESHEKKGHVKPILIKKKGHRAKQLIKAVVNKPKYDLLTPFVAYTLKERDNILKGLISVVVPPQDAKPKSPNGMKKSEECLYFPLEQKVAEYKVCLKNPCVRELLETGTNILGDHTCLTVKHDVSMVQLDENSAPIKAKTDKVSEDKDLSNLVPVQVNKEETKIIKIAERDPLNNCRKEKRGNLPTLNKKNKEKMNHKIAVLERNIPDVDIKVSHSLEPTKVTGQKKYNRSKIPQMYTSTGEKTNTFKMQNKAALPEGKTRLENVITKKATKEVETSLTTEIEPGKRKARSLWTPLEGEKPKQREKLLSGLVQHGISLPHGNTESVKYLFGKVRKNMGLPPSPKTNADKESYATTQAFERTTSLHGKTGPPKEKILRPLAMGVPLPVGRTASEESLVIHIGKDVRSSIDMFYKKKAVGHLTQLKVKSQNSNEKLLLNKTKHTNYLKKKKIADVAKLTETENEPLLPIVLPGATEKEKYNDPEYNDVVKPFKKIARNKANIRTDSRKYVTFLPGFYSKKALIDTEKNGVKSSISSSVFSSGTSVIPRNRKVMEPFSHPTKDDPKKSSRLPPESAQKQVSSAQNAKCHKPGVDSPLSLLEGMSTPQKDIFIMALAENGVVRPESTLNSQKYLTEANKTHVPPAQPVPPPVTGKFDEMTITLNNNSIGLLTPLINKMGIPKRKSLLDVARTRTHTEVKVKNNILKERSRIGPVLSEPRAEGKKKTPIKKQRSKGSVLIKNLVKPQDRELGCSVEPVETVKKNMNEVKVTKTAENDFPATYTGCWRFEATNLSTLPGGEFMTSTQKTIFQVLSKYLAQIEVD